jgi:hypothetical protein
VPADSYNILKKWRNYVCQLLNVHGTDDDRQIEMQTAEQPVPDQNPLEAEMVIKN